MDNLPLLIPQNFPVNNGNKDITIIIAHRGDELGLWATLHACEAELLGTGLTWEYGIAVNGQPKLGAGLDRMRRHFEGDGKICSFTHNVEPVAPPTARQLATEAANGKYLFFFDNHCIPSRGYFARGIESMEKYGIDILHSTTRYYGGTDYSYYEYVLSLQRDFWTRRPFETPVDPEKPYPVAMAGHGGFAARRAAWEAIGGYWQGFMGWGGEESYLDLKAWLLGHKVWIDPKLVHYHFSSDDRGDSRHIHDNFFRNMMLCANIIGGEAWMNTGYESFVKYPRRKEPGGVVPLYDLLMESHERSTPHAQWLAQRRTKSLDELLVYFDTCGIRTRLKEA